jgi:HemK-like putative methylase
MKVGTDGVLLGAWAPIKQQPYSILDIGTGTGIIALMLAQRSNAAQIDALEIDEKTYEQATDNFENSPWNDRLFCFHAGLDEFMEEPEDEYDLIVSNPPYIPESEYEQLDSTVRDFEPKMALAVEDESPLLFYERIIAYAKTNLKLNGRVYFEINQQYGELTAALFDTNLFKVALLKDYSGNDRFIKAVRIAI